MHGLSARLDQYSIVQSHKTSGIRTFFGGLGELIQGCKSYVSIRLLLKAKFVHSAQKSDWVRSLYELACGYFFVLSPIAFLVAISLPLLLFRIVDFGFIVWCWVGEFGEDCGRIEELRVYTLGCLEAATNNEYLGCD
jgi:hypothetical protein